MKLYKMNPRNPIAYIRCADRQTDESSLFFGSYKHCGFAYTVCSTCLCDRCIWYPEIWTHSRAPQPRETATQFARRPFHRLTRLPRAAEECAAIRTLALGAENNACRARPSLPSTSQDIVQEAFDLFETDQYRSRARTKAIR